VPCIVRVRKPLSFFSVLNTLLLSKEYFHCSFVALLHGAYIDGCILFLIFGQFFFIYRVFQEEKFNILGDHNIDHSKQNCIYVHVSYSERFPRWSYYVLFLIPVFIVQVTKLVQFT
jgi:hypothetical protein